MAVSKAQQRAVSKYMKNNYDEIKIRIPKGEKDRIKAYLDNLEEEISVNAFINGLIQDALKDFEYVPNDEGSEQEK